MKGALTTLSPANRTKESGFSLVELAIVLIIIGIILGAVTKGRDLIRSSEQKKIFTQFVNAWAMAYQTYHDRTGLVLGDGTQVDGSNNPIRDGLVDTQASVATTGIVLVLGQLRSVGIEIPQGLGGANVNQITYQDSNGNTNTLVLNFANITARPDWGNHIQLRDATNGIPFELGSAMDTLVDGRADGVNGNFLYTANAAGGTAATNWPAMANATTGAPNAAVPASAAIWRMPF